jgi:hypothetical protein
MSRSQAPPSDRFCEWRSFEPKLACVPEHHGAVLVGVLIERDAGRRPRKLGLAVAERQQPQILAVELQEIERVQHRVGGVLPALQRIEHGDPVGGR